ncbi:EamA family transporter [Kovacikia minuta CCNUW1]|uniref:EamA family transporter n=1 Tax=Kovacikia minuta TaxID=2931930 RepID=UPI001CD003E5|nr:EamA family transporter [Kovacikia minuta]UBF25278.1 EamA family transporter [Kovacikia minuta CCNUW1]
MKEWMLPTFGAFLCWGLWGFIPKITTRYLDPKSAIVFEVLGGICLAIITLFSLHFQPATHSKGVPLAMLTGMLGFLGAFCFLNAVSRGPVALVATLSALYPVVSVILAILVLGESITVRQGIGIGLAILSMMLVAA